MQSKRKNRKNKAKYSSVFELSFSRYECSFQIMLGGLVRQDILLVNII